MPSVRTVQPPVHSAFERRFFCTMLEHIPALTPFTADNVKASYIIGLTHHF